MSDECKYCHMEISDDNFYVCPECGAESCSDCGGKCGCEIEDEEEPS